MRNSRLNADAPVPLRLGRAISLACMVLPAAGCDSATGPSDRERELAHRRLQWTQQSLVDYDFVMRHECFCVLGGVPILVQVRGDTVTSQTVVESGTEIPTGQWPTRRTVDDLFSVLEEAFDRRAVRVEVSYDDALGYPRTAFIDYQQNAVDEEYGWTILSLTPRD